MRVQDVDLEKILEIVVAFNSEYDFIKLLDVIISKMRDITRSEAGTLYVTRDGQLHFTIIHNEKLGMFSYENEINLPPVALNADNINSISAYCAINNEMVNIDDVYKNERFNFQGPKDYDAMTGFRTQSMLVFPLADLRGDVIGVIQLINARSPAGQVIPYDAGLEFLLQSLANIAAVALANIRYMAEIKELLYSFVRVTAQAIDERSPYTANHTQQVADYAKDLVRYLRGRFASDTPYHLDEGREEQLIMAALLHDIGKIVTPLHVMDKPTRLGDALSDIRKRFAIHTLQTKVAYLSGEIGEEDYKAELVRTESAQALVERVNTSEFLKEEDAEAIRALAEAAYTDENGRRVPLLGEDEIACLSVKKGTLTDAEREIMREHVTITGKLLDNIKFSRQYEMVPEWARNHHEFLDGSGYPNQVTEEQIPMEGRILTMLDIYDALTARDRPYKRALPHDTAVKILRSMADEGKLDRELVALFDESGIMVKSKEQ